ncbi:MAG: DNA-directed RNA polymerase subunit A' [Thermoproteota archaeon]
MSYEESVKAIDGIKFSVLSPSEIRKYSVTEITAPETYDEDGLPVQGGLMDGRLGTLEPGQKCGSCGNTALRCPGHFGHIELAEPAIHIAFADNIYKLLLAFCRACGRIKLGEEAVSKIRSQLDTQVSVRPGLRTKLSKEIIMKTRKIKTCPYCNKSQHPIEFTKPTIFNEITDEGGATRLLPVAIRERLERISSEELNLLDYDLKSIRPEWFVLQVLPVPPVTVRPSITLESGIRSEDDLTHKIVDILRVNQRVRESKESGTPPLIVQDLVDLLQYHVTTFFDNEVSGIPQSHHRSGRPLKTLSQRLKGKEGRFRGSLSGKRVDFSARTVIAPDPSLDISEVGIPKGIAFKLTIPEKVTPWNVEHLKTLVKNGPAEHPGANYIIRSDGVKIRLDYVTDRDVLADSLLPGFIVERHLDDGDIVVFNRQPSLHRMSVMGHFVRVLPYRTFRLHPAVCPPYNADFDGDEMNIHVPQSTEAQAEAITLMKVHDQILSPRYGGPIIGAIRDFLTSAYLLTKDETKLSVEEFSDLAMIGGYTGELPKPIETKPKKLYSGKQLFSLFLPKDFNYFLTSKWAKGTKGAPDNDVLIRNGELLSGVIDRASIGSEEPDSILHRIAKDYSTEHAREFLNSILSVLRTFITTYGFTYGYDELILEPSAEKKVMNGIDESYENIKGHIDAFTSGELKLSRGLAPDEALENNIVSELAKARDKAGRVSDNTFKSTNSGVVMARTGARGSSLNLGQMTAALGQQSVRGKRISNGYQGRALPQFQIGDRSPDAKGFVKNNYRTGLSATEFFFHAMGGREGLVDTAVRTQQSGYMQRRLVNALEHIKVEYDLTVRDPHDHIIQFLYGEDGIDPSKSDHGKGVHIERLVELESLTSTSKSKLTDKKIESLISEYESSFNSKILKSLKESLSEKSLTATGAQNVISKTLATIKKSTVEPGEASGIVAAQSIGEPGTQMTLRTFHFAGVKERDVTLGLPRLIELVDARKSPATPAMTIYLDKSHRTSETKAMEVAKEISFTRVEDVTITHEIAIGANTNGVKIKLNSEKLGENNVTLQSVGDSLQIGKRKITVDEKNSSILVELEGSDIQALFVLRTKILNQKIKGVPGISNMTLVKDAGEWIIQASGSNLALVLRVSGVDTVRTNTNNIFEIASVLGIEAARSALISEVLNTLDEQGLEVDIRHILLVSDLMTSKGYMQQIGRHGIAGTKSSVLARAAFEITVPTLALAAINGEIEQLKGVTENVIVGAPMPVGTGIVELFMKRKK